MILKQMCFYEPWEWKVVDYEYGLYDKENDAVITQYYSDPDSASISVSGDNARLIAAAPLLYRELKHLVDLLEPVIDTVNVPGLATLNGARAALLAVMEPK
jgi:hypothetical protein